MDVLQNMMLFSELVQCGGNVYTWCYDAQGKLLRSNCPDEAFLASAFELFGCKQRMLEHGDRDDVPVTLGTALGLLWGAAFEKEEENLKRVWVIGPVFYQDVTMRGIEEGLKYYSKLEISVAWTIQLYKALEKVSYPAKHHYEPLSADDALLPDRAAAGAEQCEQQCSTGRTAEKRCHSP